jgi:probable F420-dependent oxidoreductase
MKIGLMLPIGQQELLVGPDRWSLFRDMALAAEASGLDSIWCPDHLLFRHDEAAEPGGTDGIHEAWTVLTAVAAITNRVEIGPLVLCVPFRNPALTAKMATTLDEVSGGRLILGLGAGWNEPEFASAGIPFDDRFDRFEDTLRIVTSMLRTGSSTHEGRTVTTRSAPNAPRGPRPAGLPVMVGANGPRMLRLTAELADHWNGGLRVLADVPEQVAAVEAACRAVGRDPATLTVSIETLVRVIPLRPGEPPDDREIRGDVTAIAAGVAAYGALGVDHVQVSLRPNTVEAVVAFGRVIEAVAAG